MNTRRYAETLVTRARANTDALLTKLRQELRKVGDPVKAAAMQAYMKSAMPFHGVQTPLLRQVCRKILVEVSFASATLWRKQVLHLWRSARFREERYAALYLSGDKRARTFQTPAAMKMYQELIGHGEHARSFWRTWLSLRLQRCLACEDRIRSLR